MIPAPIFKAADFAGKSAAFRIKFADEVFAPDNVDKASLQIQVVFFVYSYLLDSIDLYAGGGKKPSLLAP